MTDNTCDHVTRIAKSIEKALSNNSDGEIYDLLRALGKLSVTIKILRDTKIGIVVNNLRKRFPAENEVSILAKEIITRWKQLQVEKDHACSNKSSESSGPVPVTIKTATAKKSLNVAAMHATYANLSAIQKTVVDKFTERLKVFSATDDQARATAINIEAALSDFCGDGKSYNDKYRSLLTNMKTNQELGTKLLAGTYTAKQLVAMKPLELASVEVRKERNEAIRNEYDARRTDFEFLSVQRSKVLKSLGLKETAGFQCRKCKSTKTTYYEKQTRSGDEPMTVFIQCLSCGAQRRQ